MKGHGHTLSHDRINSHPVCLNSAVVLTSPQDHDFQVGIELRSRVLASVGKAPGLISCTTLSPTKIKEFPPLKKKSSEVFKKLF